MGSQELLERLIALNQGFYGPRHKQQLQRRIKNWHLTRVKQCLERASTGVANPVRRVAEVLPLFNYKMQKLINAVRATTYLTSGIH